MKTENPPGGQAMTAFFELPVNEFLKAIGYCERVNRTPTPTDGLAGGIVDVDDIDLFH